MTLSQNNKKRFIGVASVLFILLFVYTGASKLLDYNITVEEISDIAILQPIAKWMAWIIPVIEILIAALLVIQPTRKLALYATLVLMVIFTAYIISIFNAGEKLSCGCGGIISGLSKGSHLVLNIVLLAMCAMAIYFYDVAHKLKKL